MYNNILGDKRKMLPKQVNISTVLNTYPIETVCRIIEYIVKFNIMRDTI